MAGGDRLDHPGGDCRREDLSTVPVAFLPTCLIVPASHAAFLDRPAPAGNSRWISPRASRRCLSMSKEKRRNSGRREETIGRVMSVENERYFLLNDQCGIIKQIYNESHI